MEQPPGSDLDREQIEFLLADAWPSLRGSRAGGMQPHKIRGRTEALSWNPPHLTFEIERHGERLHARRDAAVVCGRRSSHR